ncbi:MAG TPA: beta/gamma crystallin-related protein [Candidatus Polarisedimenticolaceae bacterium]|nr:beta/gamma crystallin-related protein [Candidatus Polarisedimenticolaceae bacterium]
MRPHRCLFALALALVASQALAGIKVYTDKNYGGASIQIDSAVPDLRKLDFDDRISSLQADEKWLVCSAPKFKGDCREVEGSLVNLRAEGLNERISSLRPFKKGDEKKSKPKDKEETEKSEGRSDQIPVATPASAKASEWWGGSF